MQMSTSADSPGPGSSPPRGEGRSGFFHAVGWLGSVSAFAFMSGLVRQKVFAVFLGPAGLGVLALATSALDLLATATRLGLPTGLLREVSTHIGSGKPGTARAAYRVGTSFGLALAATVMLIVIVWAPWFERVAFRGELPAWAVPVLAIAVPFLLASQFFETGLAAVGRIRRLAFSKLLVIGLSLAVTVWLVVAYGLAGAIIQIAAIALVGFLVPGVALWGARIREPATRITRELSSGVLRRIMGVGLAEGANHLVRTWNAWFFRWMVVGALGATANGLLQGVMGLSSQYSSAVMGGIFVYLLPRLSAAAQDADRFGRELADAVQKTLVIVIPISILLMGLRGWIVPVLWSDEFDGMVPLLALSIPADVLLILSRVLQLALMAAGRIRVYLIHTIGTQIVHLALFRWGLSVGELEGALYGHLTYALVTLVTAMAILSPRGGKGSRSFNVALPLTIGLLSSLLVGLLPESREQNSDERPAPARRWAVLPLARRP